jgi:chromosome segregation ATPase
VSFLSKFIADFKKEVAETEAELGIAERKQRDRERRRRNYEDPVKTLTAEREDDKKLLNELASEYENLQTERDQLMAERDAAQAEKDKLAAELTDNRKLLERLAAQADQWLAERGQLADVLKGPGVRKLLLQNYHSDKAAKLSAAGRKELDTFMAKINAAYDLIDKIDKEAAKAAAEAKDEVDSEE